MHNISICSSLKNRCVVHTDHGTLYLLKNFLLSLKDVAAKIDCEIELVIADFNSTDINDLPQYIRNVLDSPNIKIQILNIEGKFSRGVGCNEAINSASYENILILDVDMKFDENLMNNVIKHTCINKSSYFPICYTFENDPFEKNGFWLDKGYGNFSTLKSNWKKAGKIPEYNTWGQEDFDFYHKLSGTKIREKCTNLIHQWHPSDITWKNRFYQ